MVKNFVLDTNVFMSNANALFGYDDNVIILCGTVLQELDKHKNDEGERGYNAREAIRSIRQVVRDALDGKNEILNAEIAQVQKAKEWDSIPNIYILTKHGIPLNEKGGRLLFEPDGVKQEYLPKGYELDRADNKIISSCIHMNKSYCKDNPAILLTEDASMQLNAEVCGIRAENVKNEQIEYTGYSGHVNLPIADSKIIDRLNKDQCIEADLIPEIAQLDYPLYQNQFVTITAQTMKGKQSVLTVFQGDHILKIPEDLTLNDYKIKPLNKMQRYAMWALTNPAIPLVVLEGPAGTAKTFLSLACGLSMVDTASYYGKDLSYDDREANKYYNKLIIAKPNHGGADKDYGYLPGSLEEKMGPVNASYNDNLEVILSGGDKRSLRDTKELIADFMETGIIESCPLYAIRGRTIHDSFFICDEAQNANKQLIKDIITRPAFNTKIVVAGDPTQIDNTSLNEHNNGLIYAKDSMKGDPLCAIIRFEEEHNVRSPLSAAALKRMK